MKTYGTPHRNASTVINDIVWDDHNIAILFIIVHAENQTWDSSGALSLTDCMVSDLETNVH